jgi:hypothetical protein
VLRAGFLFIGKWKLTQGHDAGLMSVQRLKEFIKEKKIKAQQYAPCDEYWLLIVVDFIDAAQEQETRIDGLKIQSEVFQRMIVYKPTFEYIVQIKP